MNNKIDMRFKGLRQKSKGYFYERGSILIYSTLVLLAVMIISLTLIRSFVPKLVISREAINSVVAIYAADSVIELCLISSRYNNPPLQIPSLSQLNDGFTISGVSMQSYPDPCPYSASGDVSARAVGTYRGISRSLEIY